MAWSGYFDFPAVNRRLSDYNNEDRWNLTGTYRFHWEVVSQSIADNTSTVKCWVTSSWDGTYTDESGAVSNLATASAIITESDLVICNPYNTSEEYYDWGYSLSTNLNTANSFVSVAGGEKTFTIQHDSEGRCTFAVTLRSSVAHRTYIAGDLDAYTSTATHTSLVAQVNKQNIYGNATLPMMFTPAKILIAYPFTRDNDPYFSFENKLGSDVTELKARLVWDGGSTDWIDLSTALTAYSFTLTDAQYASMEANLSSNSTLTVTYELYTRRNDDEYTDSKEAIFSATGVIPEVTGIAHETNSYYQNLTGSETRIIKGHNSVYAEAQFTLPSGTTLNRGFIRYDGNKEINSLATTLTNIESGIIRYYVQDSNGNYGSAEFHLDVVPYVTLTCDVLAQMSSEGVVKVNVSGNYFNNTFGNVSNSLAVQYRYRITGGEFPANNAYTVLTNVTKDGNTFSAEFEISGLDYTATYDIEVLAGDELSTAETLVTTMKALPVFDWGESDFNFNVPAYVKGAEIPSIVEQGTLGIWTYRKWSDGLAECWGTLEVTTEVSTASSFWYSSGELIETNQWYPISLVDVPTLVVTLMPTGNTWAFISPSNTATTVTSTGTYQFNSVASFGSKTYILSYNVKGRWK